MRGCESKMRGRDGCEGGGRKRERESEGGRGRVLEGPRVDLAESVADESTL